MCIMEITGRSETDFSQRPPSQRRGRSTVEGEGRAHHSNTTTTTQLGALKERPVQHLRHIYFNTDSRRHNPGGLNLNSIQHQGRGGSEGGREGKRERRPCSPPRPSTLLNLRGRELSRGRIQYRVRLTQAGKVPNEGRGRRQYKLSSPGMMLIKVMVGDKGISPYQSRGENDSTNSTTPEELRLMLRF
ncbi:hypothetical protein Pmani_035772 [Petrolisthes manimaculis]|uniref:Uncharacterized protein n=1 Tax=Petrolisthes manimaculis TaxID=1843537 RepID=A0AAE1NLN3_9EUCA|nr:hypothetical protein Pmani_035772 [Petrolisthes manimaculis]